MADYEDIILTREGRTATICINRPKKYNAFRPRTVVELVDAFLSHVREGEGASEREADVIRDVIESLHHWGIERVLLLNAHDGNIPSIEVAAPRVRIDRSEPEIVTRPPGWSELTLVRAWLTAAAVRP